MAISIVGISTKSGGCTSVTVDKPTGTSNGDLMLMCYTTEDRNFPVVSPGVLPDGWTEYIYTYNLDASNNYGHLRVAYKIASNEGTSYDINFLNKNICIGIITVRGQAIGDGWKDQFSTSVVSSGATCPGITPSANDSLIILTGGGLRSTALRSNYANATNPLTWTEQWSFAGNRDVSWCAGADGVSGGLITSTQSSAGPTGQFSFTSSVPNNEASAAFNILAGTSVSRDILIRKKPGGGIFVFKTGEYVQQKKLAVNLNAQGENGVGIVGYYTGITWTPSSTGVQRNWLWNYLPSDVLGSLPTTACTMTLKYTDNTVSSYNVRIASIFSANYNNGKSTGNNTGIYPDSVITMNLANYSGGNTPMNVRLSGLTTTMTYKLTFMGSRTDPGFTCGSIWTITGGTSKDGTSVTQTVNDNTLNTVSISQITPNASGIIDIAMTYAGPSQGEWCSIEIDENS